MKRSKEYWQAKYALGDLSLNEFLQKCKPKGKMILSLYFEDSIIFSREVLNFWIWNHPMREPFVEIYLIENDKIYEQTGIKFGLNQKIKIEDNSILVVDQSGNLCKILFESKPMCDF